MRIFSLQKISQAKKWQFFQAGTVSVWSDECYLLAKGKFDYKVPGDIPINPAR